MVLQCSAKHKEPVAGWHWIGLAREVKKEAKLLFPALQRSKEYFEEYFANLEWTMIKKRFETCNQTFPTEKKNGFCFCS